MAPAAWIGRALGAMTGVLVAVFGLTTVFAAIVVPYRFWDSLAFGSWSRSIAVTGHLWAAAGPLNVTRPLFYVPQGLVWRWISEGEWLGRLLSAAFGAVLVSAVWLLARQLTRDRSVRAFAPPLAVGTLLASSVFATYVAAGMTDVPVAAASAATAAVLWSGLPRGAIVPLAALGAAATVLAKPSGLLALLGLVLATVVLRRRASVEPLAGAVAGLLLALAYDAWQAGRMDVSLATMLRAGNDDFWLARGSAVRADVVAAGAWVGEGARLLVVFGIAHGLARIAGARSRVALSAAAVAAIAWSLLGPIVSDGSPGYPLDGIGLGTVGWLVLAGAMIAAPFLAGDDPVPRRVYAALALWVAPTALTWAWQRPDEARLLAPAWPGLALLAALALTSVSLSLLRARPAAALAPAAAIAVVALANLVSVDGLGRAGWVDLLELGPSGWRDRAEMENFAYGPFSYELDLARENVAPGERIVSSDGRLQYFFPGRVGIAYASRCGELDGARFFSYLTAGESLEFARLQAQPTDPLGWLQCARPRVELVGEHAGIYEAFVVGRPPARTPTAADCGIAGTPGEKLDAVFGRDLSYGQARELLRRALAVGFTGTRIERTGCSLFRVVVTGIPPDAGVRAEFAREVEGVGLGVEYTPAVRFPEASPDVSPVAP